MGNQEPQASNVTGDDEHTKFFRHIQVMCMNADPMCVIFIVSIGLVFISGDLLD
jgi:hypothetical protein